jgi:hypothetical protein
LLAPFEGSLLGAAHVVAPAGMSGKVVGNKTENMYLLLDIVNDHSWELLKQVRRAMCSLLSPLSADRAVGQRRSMAAPGGCQWPVLATGTVGNEGITLLERSNDSFSFPYILL